jgi:hypothetical protein
MKSVLEAIPVYWMSLDFIPRGVLDKLKQISFRFLWTCSREKKGIPLVKWNRLVVPKDSSGWGLKNPCHFAKALTAKNVWRLL